MSGQRRRRRNNRGGATQQPAGPNRWAPVPEPPPAEPITPIDDPTALVRSLGRLNLPGQGAATEHELAKVILRASALATALATANGLVDPGDES